MSVQYWWNDIDKVKP